MTAVGGQPSAIDYQMNTDLPRFHVPLAPQSPFELDDTSAWEGLPEIKPFLFADGSGPAEQQTIARVCCDASFLYIRYDCFDRDIWGTYTERDQPIYNEEVCEVFIAEGTDAPARYFEIQVSPNGVLFDARVYNPTSTRADLRVDETWNCPGIRWMAERNDSANHWWAGLALPRTAITPEEGLAPLPFYRANLYRIERPRDGETEYSCWSPTLTEPADFHKPKRFGFLECAV